MFLEGVPNMKSNITAALFITATTLLGFGAADAQAAGGNNEDLARIENCVKITMRVKGCGEDGLAPCESSYCYDSYDFKIAESASDRITNRPVSAEEDEVVAKPSPAKHSKKHGKKLSKRNSA